jgi:hypothetical protein
VKTKLEKNTTTFATPTGNLKDFPSKVIITTRSHKPKAI